ncbi:hypothetical protein DV451_000683 [Geotrichum candidum]|uniref:3'(2'),5'-bisphosphate nucleotidase n=1 Tax=Geotrichum candidum TaxID=1173061 RepID=A0A9P5KUF8_GEOCN|nr:hypothetical protein DV451_000683 [Geotrichum candidum]
MSFVLERKIAELAVKRASRLAKLVADSHDINSITKPDQSPVTIADFGAQAVIISALKHVFPNDKVVGEEDADDLRKDPKLRETVWNLIKEATSHDTFSNDIGVIETPEEMMDAIDWGNYTGGPKGRMWALDPIDGTKGFLRKGQYAVCLALAVDSEVVVGAIGCPNLPIDYKSKSENPETGVLFTAIANEGAFQTPLFIDGRRSTKIEFNSINSAAEATFCESVEAGHSSHDTQAKIAKALGITKPSVRMDSQAKYCSIARGDGDIYLRLPVSATYEEKIWDHAAGNVLIHEAGGVVTDMFGNKLDFGVGRTLKNNKGVVAAAKNIHPEVLAAVKAATGN